MASCCGPCAAIAALQVPGRAIMDVTSICPSCSAAGRLRPDIVWFGEMPYRMDEVHAALERCAIFIAIGTSGVVYPAAGFVEAARAARCGTDDRGQSGAHGGEFGLCRAAVRARRGSGADTGGGAADMSEHDEAFGADPPTPAHEHRQPARKRGCGDRAARLAARSGRVSPLAWSSWRRAGQA